MSNLAATMTVQMIPVGQIRPGNNDRKSFDPIELDMLARSIAQSGLIQPVTVRPEGDAMFGPSYVLVAGERRWRASQLAGLTEIPALVRGDLSDDEAWTAMLVENIQRHDLPLIQEALAVAARVDAGMDPAELARSIGKPIHWVENRIRLANLDPKLAALLQSGDLPGDWARALALIPGGSWQVRCYEQMMAKHAVRPLSHGRVFDIANAFAAERQRWQQQQDLGLIQEEWSAPALDDIAPVDTSPLQRRQMVELIDQMRERLEALDPDGSDDLIQLALRAGTRKQIEARLATR